MRAIESHRGGPSTLERDRNLTELLGDAWRLFQRRFGIALVVAAIVVVPVEIIIFGIGLGELTSGYDGGPPAGEVLFALLVSALVTTPLVTGMLVHVASAEGREQPVGVGEAVRAGLESFGPLIVAVLLYTTGTALGFLALVVPGIFLALRWSLVAPVVVVEGRRGTGALRRSWDLVKGHTGWVLLVLVVQSFLAAIVAVFIAMPGDALAKENDAQVYALLGGIVAQVFTLPFTAFVTTLLFYTLRARSHGVTTDARGSAPSDAPGGWEPPVPPR